MYTTENFIKKAKEVHGDKYDYSKVEYCGSRKKVCIICPEHGEFFQEPSAHLRGYKCPKCGNFDRGRYKRFDKETFIQKAKEVHGEKYDYSKVEYVNSSTKVCIICHEHGEFLQIPMAHLNGEGCPKCKNKNLTREELIDKFIKVHGDKYDYSKFELTKMSNKSIIVCPEHGEFLQSPTKHLIGHGCPECGKTKNKYEVSSEDFIRRANKIHGNKYDYSNIVLRGMNKKVDIVCPNHGVFKQYAYDHLNGHGCPYCGILISNSEIEIYDYICGLLGKENVVKHDRAVIGDGKEIDIYVPSFKVGIEFDGLKWHSDEFKSDKNYHLQKTELCAKKGVRLIHIFEDEYKFSKEIVLSKLRHLFFMDDLPKIPGRMCEIKSIDVTMAKSFLSENHIQGFAKSTVYYGAFYCNVLVGVMCFMMERENNWVLTRFASDNKLICQGVGGKLFKYFVNDKCPNKVKTFADRRWTFYSDDNLYLRLGFRLTGVLKPDYRYINKSKPEKRIHKFNFRKKRLNKIYGFPLSMTETEMTEKMGYAKIWDCGLYKYEWTKKADV